MPLQNRVTPFGNIVAVSQRGLFTGNRGIIHDPATKTLLGRGWTTKAWICCTLRHKNVRRDVMARRSWTELFFLDEATSLAAGHRPCFECRRADAKAFQAAWSKGHGSALPKAAEMDALLHTQRLAGPHPLPDHLPTGAMITDGEDAFLVRGGETLRWRFDGYGPGAPKRPARLLTPPATVAVLSAGYQPVLHPSAG